MPRQKIEDARDRLLSAGLSLFAHRGTERVNSNAIARRAGLGIGTFYAHFPDKHALLREIELRTLGAIQSARIQAMARAGNEPRAQVRESITAVAHFARLHPEAYRVTFGRERAGARAHGAVVSDSSRPVASAMRRLQAAGQVDASLDPDLAARAYLSMEVGTLLWWLDEPTRVDVEALVETLTQMHPAVSQRTSYRIE
jgi:AcrR family transcriptional regulator